MRKLSIILFVLIFSSITSYSQDTVYVDGYYATGGTYGTLNDAIDAANEIPFVEFDPEPQAGFIGCFIRGDV